GYLTAGAAGSLLAMAAICIPPLLVLIIERVYQRIRHLPAVEGFAHGLSLAVVGIFAQVLVGLLRSQGVNLVSASILVCAIGLGTIRRLPVAAVLAAAALAGIVARAAHH
ncbi:MAG TPA: chromate transporter, partial [Chthonomonadales bacterium]|nr:chromate transporter [Chthonomonadales bacterium]